MDAIPWFANIYHQFETMCLEVDEIMQEQRLRYEASLLLPECANAKPLYSELMEDVLSEIGNEEHASCESSSVQNTDGAGEVSKETVVEHHSDEEPCNVSDLLHPCSVELLKVTQLDLCLDETVDAVMSKKSEVSDEETHSKEMQFQLETSDKMTTEERDSSIQLSLDSDDMLGSNTSTIAILTDVPSSNTLKVGEFCEHEVLDAVGKSDKYVDDNTSLGSSYKVKLDATLDESCIMVDGSELPPLISRKHGFVKAFTAKWKARKQVAFGEKRRTGKHYRDEQEGLHGNLDTESIQQEGEDLDTESSQKEGEGSASSSITSSDQESFESDWEII